MFLPSVRTLSIYISRRQAIGRVWQRRFGRFRLVRESRVQSTNAVHAAQGIVSTMCAGNEGVADWFVFVGASELRVGLIERKPGVASRADWQALAGKEMLTDRGLAGAGWNIGVDLLPGARFVLAVAIKTSLVDALERTAAGHGAHIRSVRPLSVEMLRREAQRDGGADGITMAERDAVATFVDSGQVRGAYAVMSDDGRRDLSTELARARLLIRRSDAINLRAFLFDASDDKEAACAVKSPRVDFSDLWREIPL